MSSLSGRLRPAAPWLGLAALFVLIGLLAAPGAGGTALDPNGTSPQGAKALVLLLREYGAQVAISADGPPAGSAALVLTDQLDDARRAEVVRWVRGGGHLVVADPGSTLQLGLPQRPGNGLTSTDLHPSGPCGIAGLETIRALDVGTSDLLTPRPGTLPTGCFRITSGRRDRVFLLSSRFGAGSVVGLGGAGLWTNQRLGHQDNAALAVDLLAPSPGEVVTVLLPSRAGSGQRSGLQLVSPRFREALVQLLVAFGVLAWWRGRRLGAPVLETPPVEVPASEIVRAAGDLMARTGSRDAAAAELRDGARRALGERLGLGAAATPEVIASLAVDRLGIDRDLVLELLSPNPVRDDASLVRLAVALAQLRQEALHARTS